MIVSSGRPSPPTSSKPRRTPNRGVPAGSNRRVPGLRRAEVAALAGVSAGVLDAIARALRLDDAERAHLYDLARAADGSPLPRRRCPSSRGDSKNADTSQHI
jgi:hypothetical protein